MGFNEAKAQDSAQILVKGGFNLNSLCDPSFFGYSDLMFLF